MVGSCTGRRRGREVLDSLLENLGLLELTKVATSEGWQPQVAADLVFCCVATSNGFNAELQARVFIDLGFFGRVCRVENG